MVRPFPAEPPCTPLQRLFCASHPQCWKVKRPFSLVHPSRRVQSSGGEDADALQQWLTHRPAPEAFTPETGGLQTGLYCDSAHTVHSCAAGKRQCTPELPAARSCLAVDVEKHCRSAPLLSPSKGLFESSIITLRLPIVSSGERTTQTPCKAPL